MMVRRMAYVALLLASLSASGVAAPDGIDRDRLKRAAQLPSVGERYIWNFGISHDGRLREGGQMLAELDPAPLRASLSDEDSHAELWMDLAGAYRLRDDTTAEKECLARAIAILRRRKSARPDDGTALAALGLALAASGADRDADAEVAAAEIAPRSAWAGVAAKADLIVIRAASTMTGGRVATTEDISELMRARPKSARGLDVAACDAAQRLYDRAALAVASEGVTGPAGSSVFVRRGTLVQLMAGAKTGKLSDARRDDALDDAADLLQPGEPFAVLRMALTHAMSVPDEEGSRHVEAWEKLSAVAQTRVTADLARLQELTMSADAATAARAWQAIATLHWYCKRDRARTEALLRKAIATDPKVRQSWNALASVLEGADRQNDLVTMCREWVAVDPTPRRRMVLASALVSTGKMADAETEWRAALAADPDSAEAKLGVAVLMLRRTNDEAEIREAAALVQSAIPLAEKAVRLNSWLLVRCHLADAVARGLAGDVDGAEKSARRVLELWDKAPPAREVLAAIGR
jgi:tetratricopeptide (TPR) repeat protein